MLVPAIVVTAAPDSKHILSESRPTKLRKTFGFTFHKKSGENCAPRSRLRSRSPSPLRIPEPSPKRKESSSPVMLKRKYLRKVKLTPLAQLTGSKTVNDPPDPESPSIFEEELADNDNKSPNDPEFVRRTSERWQRKTGAVQPPLHLISTIKVQQPALVWPSSPSQQPAFRRRVSPLPLHYLPHSPFLSAPCSPVSGRAFTRGSSPYSSLATSSHSLSEQNFLRGSRCYSSLGLPDRNGSKSSLLMSPSRSRKGSFHLSPIISRKSNSQLSPSRPRKGSLTLSPSTQRKSDLLQLSPFTPRKHSLQPPSQHSFEGDRNGWSGVALDDTVTAEVRRHHMRELVGAGLTAPFLRLSVRLRRSFRRSRQKESTLSTSASCHSDLLHLQSCSPPASPSSIPRSASLPPDAHSFADIFLEEPQLAHKFVRRPHSIFHHLCLMQCTSYPQPSAYICVILIPLLFATALPLPLTHVPLF